MNLLPTNQNTYQVSTARPILGNLVDQVSEDNVVFISKSGIPSAALIDIDLLNILIADAEAANQKTFIDKQLLNKTRIFDDAEIAAWQEEDQL